ncbi:MAG: hypothetical protein CMJ78_20885 [Planctomycetaceae bacterium]|nr:hypothetical protein [Planctomycetaceae bacterium]
MDRKGHALGDNPLSEDYARANLIIPDDIFWTCPTCRRVHRCGEFERVIEWPVGKYDTGSDVIGDLTWHGAANEVLVSDRVRAMLQDRTASLEFRAIGMWQDPKVKKPKHPRNTTKRRVWLPYAGPPIWELQVKSICRLNWKAMNLSIKSQCSECHNVVYHISDKQLIIDEATWDGAPIFRIDESDMIFVIDELLSGFQKNGFTNYRVRRTALISDSNA